MSESASLCVFDSLETLFDSFSYHKKYDVIDNYFFESNIMPFLISLKLTFQNIAEHLTTK